MPTIALLTDFGTRDPYVASLKGVVASRCDAPVVDLTHEIPPFDIWEAAWFLRTVAPWWPAATIFVCVVDPGVGTSRRILAMESAGRRFLAPDNGLLTFLEGGTTVSVQNEAFFLERGSTTFHGRDRFAPVAAAIARGTPLDQFGPPAGGIVRLDYTPPGYAEVTTGTVVRIDRFGNCITDVERARLSGHRFTLRAGAMVIERNATTYSGEGPFLITGSNGTIEISVANGSAAAAMGIERGMRVEVFGPRGSAGSG